MNCEMTIGKLKYQATIEAKNWFRIYVIYANPTVIMWVAVCEEQ